MFGIQKKFFLGSSNNSDEIGQDQIYQALCKQPKTVSFHKLKISLGKTVSRTKLGILDIIHFFISSLIPSSASQTTRRQVHMEKAASQYNAVCRKSDAGIVGVQRGEHLQQPRQSSVQCVTQACIQRLGQVKEKKGKEVVGVQLQIFWPGTKR